VYPHEIRQIEASVAVKDLKLAASRFVTPASGFDGFVNLEGKLNSDGNQAKTSGTLPSEP
jgi:hypothetical protein